MRGILGFRYVDREALTQRIRASSGPTLTDSHTATRQPHSATDHMPDEVAKSTMCDHTELQCESPHCVNYRYKLFL